MEHLEEKLQLHADKRIKLVITDGVFSMDGDIARLDEMVKLCEKYDALILIDDSHASGFIGRTGKGTHEYCNVVGKVDIITTTFGKALGGASGGCVSGRREIVALCRQRARPYLFSNTIAPVIVSGVLKVFDILSSSTERRDKLEKNAAYWRKGLTEAGFILK
jgi:glycine C-acetyltransferase